MPAKKLAASEVGLPRFPVEPAETTDVFAFSSHRRAREALDFGLDIDDAGFNVFVLGEDRSGRMTATLAYLRAEAAARPRPDDWIYLNNFRRPHRPRPHRLPAGIGRRFRDRMADTMARIREALTSAFTSEANQSRIAAENERLRGEIAHRIEDLRAEARRRGLDIAQTAQDLAVVRARGENAQPDSTASAAPPTDSGPDDAARRITAALEEINRWAGRAQAEAQTRLQELGRSIADEAISDLLDDVAKEFSGFSGLARWLVELRADLLDNLSRFRPIEGDAPTASETPERRYAVNLFVDHSDDAHPLVVLESNPTYENLFGRIEYRQIAGGLDTDFSLIRSGALHRANGGFLVLRAEALARQPAAWEFLKGALRDGVIRTEELHRAGSVPIAGAPQPKPIPLQVKVIVVGSPRWYYTFFSADSDFRNYFKIKADIDPDMEATRENLRCYAGLIRAVAARHAAGIEDDAVSFLFGIVARNAADRQRLSARFELVDDVIAEAVRLPGLPSSGIVTARLVRTAIAARRRRNARVEDRLQDSIRRGTVTIDVTGDVIGQVNALTVRDLGDHEFGTPARVTARASIGRRGIVNIERDTELGGPIQQKGAMVLHGFLAGHFARRIPLSFTCSITFEQSYGGVEGDSASLAELIATLSDLAGTPIRQSLAITGSVDQRGRAQAIGGAHRKIEGFFRTCREAGELTGEQGAIIPFANESNLVLDEEVTDAVAAGRFHIWSVTDVDEALELMTGVPAGVPDDQGRYPADSVYGRVAAQLESFNRLLARSEHEAG